MLFRDNLIIRLVLVYRSKENLRFKLSNSFLFHFFIRHSTVSHLFPAVSSIQAHLPCVFDKTRVFRLHTFATKTKVSGYKRFREE